MLEPLRTTPMQERSISRGPAHQVITLPKRQDVPFDINELFVVEVCSR